MSKPWIVLKYGGTSVATYKNWGVISRRTKELLPTNRVWLVVSALSSVTNLLLKSIDDVIAPAAPASGGGDRFAAYHTIVDLHRTLATEMGLSAAHYAPVEALLEDLKRLLDGILLTQEVSPRLRARVAAYGELLSSQLGAAYLVQHEGLNAVRVDSRALLACEVDDTRTEADTYLEADVRPTPQVKESEAAASGADVVICQGFICRHPVSGATCLLGRGGSDTSGALFAATIGAERLEIWTDVNGLYTADPRYVPRARLIRSCTYREAQELAAMGAKVLHPRCLLPAATVGIPVEVRNTMDAGEEAEITVISVTGEDYRRRSSSSSSGSGCASAAAGATGGAGASASLPLTVTTTSSAAAAGSTTTTTTTNSSSSSIIFTASPHAGLHVSTPSGTGATMLRSGSGSALSTLDASLAAPGGAAAIAAASGPAKVLAVARRKGVTLVNIEAFDMWGTAGFLSRVFAPFTAQGVSIDLIATSQYAVSLTLDHIPEGVHGDTFRRVLAAVGKMASVSVRYPCAVVSVVGRALRTALPRLGAAMKALDGVPVHLVSEACEDLNLSFVVDEEHADKLVAELHATLLETDEVAGDEQFGPVWTDMPYGGKPLPGGAPIVKL